jgi:hypothetical protein
MQIDTPRQFFDQLAKQGRSAQLVNCAGSWEFVIEGAGSWRVEFDHGTVRVLEERAGDRPLQAGARVRMKSADFVRLARGDGHENVITSLLRGAVQVEGDIRVAQYIQNVLPVPTDWENAS